MVDTIGAAVRGEGRKRGFLAAGLHVIGATLTATLLGAALGATGALLGASWGPLSVVMIAALALLYLLRETLHVPIPVPQSRRQVPDWWRSFYTAPTAAFLFGAGLGVGFFTFLSYGTFVVVAVAALVSGDPWIGAALCGPFGLARATAAALAASRSRTGHTAARVERLGEGRWPRTINSIALAAVTVAAIATYSVVG